MLTAVWKFIAIPLGFIMKYCYLFVNDILHLPLAYVFALLLFTIITKALMFPLSLKQQRSTAMMAAYKPMLDDINKKYAGDKQKQQEEMMKLQQEYGYNPMSGCLPLLIQFPILFGLVEVIYAPLTYMLRIPTAVLDSIKTLTASITGYDVSNRLIEDYVIAQVKTNADKFTALAANNTAGVTAEQFTKYINQIRDLDMNIGPINLYDTPDIKNISLIILIPIFSIVTMLLSTLISSKLSGQQQASGKQMMPMMIMSTALFAFFSFSYPAGFSLYWGLQNVVLILQALILHKMIDPKKLEAEVLAKIESKKKAKKQITKVAIADDAGNIEYKELTGAEKDKLRLQRAREIDRERYGE